MNNDKRNRQEQQQLEVNGHNAVMPDNAPFDREHS